MANGNRNPRTRMRRVEQLTWASGGSATLDFMRTHKLQKPIARIHFRFAFQITGVTGAATLRKDAGVALMANRMEITAHHKELGQVTLVDLSGDSLGQLWHFTNDLIGKEQDFSDPTPAAAATADGRREFIVCLDSPYSRARFGSRIDPRDLSNFQVKIVFGAPADYASVNVPTVALATIVVHVEEILEGIQMDGAYFLPTYKEVQVTIGAASQTDFVLQGITTGCLIPIASLEPHDDSATGNAQRNAPGLVRRVQLDHDGDQLVEKETWEALRGQGEDSFPLSYTTTKRDGPVSVLFDKDRNFLSMIDNRSKPITGQLDTSSAVQQGTTAITPAANDRLDILFIGLRPNNAMRKVVDRHYAA